jgi:predicted ABC-type exoprotein transport system permease subunit
MAKWYLKLNAEQKAFFIMAALALIIFILLCPLFFFYDVKGYSYPLGWLLGSAIELLAYWTILKMSQALFKKEDAGHQTATSLALLSNGFRFILYAIGLFLSAICTFKSEWFGGFDAFNFYACAAAYMPMLVIVMITQWRQAKGMNAHPTTSVSDEKSDNK